MPKRGRPKGTGYDDAGFIGQVLDLMTVERLSRRSAIIRICGFDQLRRIELKMAAIARTLSATGSYAMSVNEENSAASLGGKIYDICLSDVLEAAERQGFRLLFGDDPGLAAKKEDMLVMSFMANPIDLGTPHRSNTLNPFAGPFPDLGIVLD